MYFQLSLDAPAFSVLKDKDVSWCVLWVFGFMLVICFLQSFYTHVFNGCYAVLLFIVVIFFLIYGVEVFFKVCYHKVQTASCVMLC